MQQTDLSVVHGASEPPLLNRTIGQQLDLAARQWPDRDAVVSPSQGMQLSYFELRSRANKLAAGFWAFGVRPGDRIGLWAPNRIEWPIVQYAAIKLGAILVSLHPTYREAELAATLNATGCEVLVTAGLSRVNDHLQVLQDLLPELARSSPGSLVAARVPALRLVVSLDETQRPGFVSMTRLDRAGCAADLRAVAETMAQVRSAGPASIQFTSGTTGRPKGVTLSHHSMLNNAYFSGLGCWLTYRDRICVPVPLCHAFGLSANLAALCHGCAVVYPGSKFDADVTLQTVRTEGCTVLLGVPAMFFAELDLLGICRADLTTLRTAIVSGAPCPAGLLARIETGMDVDHVIVRYGMTENSPTAMMTNLYDVSERRLTTVGRVQPHIEAKVVDASGLPLRRGMPGELLVRGYSVMMGYWADNSSTAQAIDPDGWLHTGDLAVLDWDGYCQIVGRLKEIIIRGGENINPGEIEELLYTHAGVAQAYVIGVPDPRYGEEICAWIKPADQSSLCPDEIRDFCRDQIARHKVPRYILFASEFPKTPNGKVRKAALRERAIDFLGASELEVA